MLWPRHDRPIDRACSGHPAGSSRSRVSGLRRSRLRELVGLARSDEPSVNLRPRRAQVAPDQEPALRRRRQRARVHLGRGGQGPHDDEVASSSASPPSSRRPRSWPSTARRRAAGASARARAGPIKVENVVADGPDRRPQRAPRRRRRTPRRTDAPSRRRGPAGDARLRGVRGHLPRRHRPGRERRGQARDRGERSPGQDRHRPSRSPASCSASSTRRWPPGGWSRSATSSRWSRCRRPPRGRRSRSRTGSCSGSRRLPPLR